MKIIRNDIIPFKGYKCVNLFGILFVRKDVRIDAVDINHEEIHTAQMKEMLYVFFYLWYLIEWIFRLFQYKFTHGAYRNISFEREAYANQGNVQYLQGRKLWAWVKYLKGSAE